MAALIDKSVLALGFFDSVHNGHRYLLKKAENVASQLCAELCVLTFNDEFFANLGRKDKEVYLLEERISIFQSLGIENVKVLQPTKEFLAQSPEEFLDFLLEMNVAAIVAGSDYTFGRLGQGNMRSLKGYMKSKGVTVLEVDLQKYQAEKISTTKIKEFLELGEIESANLLLGDRYFVSGAVQKGRGVGKTIGIPTANITVANLKQLPKEGVYKTYTQSQGRLYPSVTNVGAHPTFEDKNFNVETLLLGFEGCLYDKNIKIFFESRIRDVKKFDSAQQLVKQIKNDIFEAFGNI